MNQSTAQPNPGLKQDSSPACTSVLRLNPSGPPQLQ